MRIGMIAAVAILMAPVAAFAQKTVGAADIGYLAHLDDSNSAFFNANILGVWRFDDVGIVDSQTGKGPNQQLVVDMGDGQVDCNAGSGGADGVSIAGLHPGEKVEVSGSVGGAVTGASIAWMVPNAKDGVTLLTGTCAVKKLD